MAAKALDNELNAGAPAAPAAAAVATTTQVNDLTSMVKKKKKPVAENQTHGEPTVTSAVTNGGSKRKAEDEPSASPSEKKARLEEEAPAS